MLAVVFAAAEPSKVPWFIAGGVLALYAVILAAIGLRNPEFPFNLRGQRLVMLVTLRARGDRDRRRDRNRVRRRRRHASPGDPEPPAGRASAAASAAGAG